MSAADPCAPFEADLSALLDDELDAAREQVMRAHLETCASCSAVLEQLCSVDLALASGAAPVVPADLRARIDARIHGDAHAEPSSRQRVDPVPGRPERDRPAPPGRRSRTRPQTNWGWRAAGYSAVLAATFAVYVGVTPRGPDLDAVPEEELAVVLELDTIEDYEVIANLPLLERLVALEEGAG